MSCSSSSDSSDASTSAGAGNKTGGSGKAGAADSDNGGDSSSEGGAAGSTDTSPGGDSTVPAGGSTGGSAEAGAAGEPSLPTAGSGGTGGAVDPTAAAITRAQKLFDSLDMPCVQCHGAKYSGNGHWPNITPDENTGIGDWTDDQIKAAITQGKGEDGHTFCAEMQRFPFSDSQLADVLVFLHNLAPVTHAITQKCTTQ